MPRAEYITALIFILMAGVTGYGFLNLSGQITVNFSSATSQGSMDLLPGLSILPVISIVIYVLLSNVRRFESLSKNYESFKQPLKEFKILLVGVFTYLQFLIVFWNLGFEFELYRMIFIVVFLSYLWSSRLLGMVERNRFFGIRNPWTLSSEKVWEKTHEKASTWLLAASFLTVPALIMADHSIYYYAIPALLLAIGSTVYSYWLYKNEK